MQEIRWEICQDDAEVFFSIENPFSFFSNENWGKNFSQQMPFYESNQKENRNSFSITLLNNSSFNNIKIQLPFFGYYNQYNDIDIYS